MAAPDGLGLGWVGPASSSDGGGSVRHTRPAFVDSSGSILQTLVPNSNNGLDSLRRFRL